LDIRRTALDSLHPNIALSLNNLANAWYGLGEYEKSNSYHFEALRLRRKIFGENHRAVAMSYANIGHNLVLLDNPDKATYYFKKVVPVMIELYGTEHLLTSDAYANLGLPFYYSGAYDRPLKILSFFKGIVAGLISILVVYALLPLDWRYSRALIFLGAAWSLIALLGLRLALHLAGRPVRRMLVVKTAGWIGKCSEW